YEMKDWDRQGALFSLDYRATGPFCMSGMGKILLKIFNQSTAYLVTKDTVIAFTQKDALRSLPLGFNKQGDLLITYTTAAAPNKFNIGVVMHSGDVKFPADIKGFNTDSIKGKYWYQGAN